MKENCPLASVGLPVFNGERFLEDAIRSVLDQDLDDFELIISDNASTDTTPQICQDYASGDRRILYRRNSENLGAAPNFNSVVNLARGKYFKWISADGEIKPAFLSACIDALNQDEEAILACTKYLVMRENGNIEVPPDHLNNLALTQERPSQRLQEIIPVGVLPIWGVIRLEKLKETKLIRSTVAADRNLIIDLAIKGKFLQVPEYYALLKRHPDSYTDRLLRSKSQIEGAREAKWFDARNKKAQITPRWRALREAFKSASAEALPGFERISLYYVLITSVGWGWRTRLVKELFIAFGLIDLYYAIKKIVK